jgi:EAL domain-containing protein (putative c-di-GMP-specific phosphodiesterase class I)
MLISDLRAALNNQEVQLYYQPQMHLASHKITGAEALLRWTHPRHGCVPPDQIMPLAENSGMIRQLTLYVLDMAIRQCRQWHMSGHKLNISVNLSTLNLLDQGISVEIDRLVGHYQLPHDALTLEITETAFMSDIERAVITLNNLHEKGIRISVDDYGTGFSSLAYLKRLPVNELKIDRSFVMNMETSDNDAVIVRSTIDLAHNLSLNVVAEGVEDKETMNVLKGLGCDSVQGYHLGKPMPADEFEKWLNRQQSAYTEPSCLL